MASIGPGPTSRGISPSRFRTVRVSTGQVAGLGEVNVTVDFDPPFPDTAYTVSVVVELDEDGESLRARRVRTVTAGGCVVNVANAAATSRTGTLHVIAIHD